MSSYADILITNANVFTSDPSNSHTESVALKGNRIVFAGNNQDAQEWRGQFTRVIAAGGKTLMPGFIDCHFHMLMGSLSLDDLHPDTAGSYEEFVAMLHAFSKEHPDRSWLTGFGLHYDLGPGHTPLNRHHLDAVVNERPVFIIAYDGHTAWANTLALKQADIFHGGDCGVNSEIVLDEHGEATGELRENGAQAKIENHLPPHTYAEKSRFLKKGLQLASQLGITSIHNMDGDSEQTALYAAFHNNGDLSVRVYFPYSVTPQTAFKALEQEAAPLKVSYRSDMLRSGSIKIFMDGVIESYTGLLVDEYTDRAGTCGASNYSTDHFNQMVIEADRLGLQVCVHSVGDGGVRNVLDAYAEAARLNGSHNRRHRVEHIEVIHPRDVARFAELGVIASMQPLHAPPSMDSGDIWIWRVGEERWPFSFAWTTLREAGARLVFGSDWPIVSQNPMLGIHNTLNRLPWKEGLPNHRQSLVDTLHSYTREAAYAEFQEHQKGQIKVGYLADLVLLSEDIFKVPSEMMKDVYPTMTIRDGKIVFESQ
jgi:predicted amidohydrolase YtcJ